MRKTAIHLFMILLSVLILASCQQQQAVSPAASVEETVAAPTETPLAQPEVSQTQKKYTPADIFDGELNPFYGMQLPENFTLESVFIHTPGWGIIGDTMQYHMYLLAPKDNETIITIANMLGVTSKDVISSYIETFQKDGRIMIDGSETQSGTNCICEILTTPKDNGWQIQLVSSIEEKNEAKYAKFIEDNYNMNVFGTVSKSLTLMPVPDNFKINVCYVDVNDLMKTEFEVAYTVDNRPTIMDTLLTGGGYDWYDSANKKIGIDYGDIHGDVWFTGNSNQINVYQSCKGIPATPLRDYVFQPVMTLETYGFRFDAEKGISLYENKAEQESKLGFHSPAWGGKEQDWGVEFLYSFKEGLIVVWYRPEENKFDIRIEKGGDVAGYAYNIETNVYESMYPDKETVNKYLNDLYADPNVGDLYGRIFGILEQYCLDISGKEFAQLASLPPMAGDSFAPMTELPPLPEAGKTRTTLATMGFEFIAEDGFWIYRDTETMTDIHICNEANNMQPEEWNKNVITYFNAVNGHQLVISCYPNEGRYQAQVYEEEQPTEGGTEASFVYDSKNKAVLDRVSLGTDMKPEEFFSKMLGIPQTDAIFTDVIGIFDTYIMEQFGLTPEELFRIDTE